MDKGGGVSRLSWCMRYIFQIVFGVLVCQGVYKRPSEGDFCNFLDALSYTRLRSRFLVQYIVEQSLLR